MKAFEKWIKKLWRWLRPQYVIHGDVRDTPYYQHLFRKELEQD